MSLFKRAMELALAVSLAMSASAALAIVAPPFAATAGDASAPVMGQARPTLTFTFDVPYDFTGVTLYVDYDPSLMTFNAAASTLKFGPLVGGYQETLDLLVATSPLDPVLGHDFSYFADESTSGQYSLIATFATQSYLLPSGASFVLTGAFDLKPEFTVGMISAVNLHGALTSTAHDADPLLLPDTFGQGLLDLTGPVLSATVSAVPEPETWLMMLCGIGLMVTRVRRVSAKASSSYRS